VIAKRVRAEGWKKTPNKTYDPTIDRRSEASQRCLGSWRKSPRNWKMANRVAAVACEKNSFRQIGMPEGPDERGKRER